MLSCSETQVDNNQNTNGTFCLAASLCTASILFAANTYPGMSLS